MSVFQKIKNHPFRVLLYLEWILLIISFLIEFIRPPMSLPVPPPILHPHAEPMIFASNPLLLFLGIVSFGIMGLFLLTGNFLSKLIYTSLELILILSVSTIVGQDFGFSPPLLLILVIRSCLRFEFAGRLLVTGIVLTCFTLNVLINSPKLPRPPETISYDNNLILNLTINLLILFTLVLMFLFLLVNALLAERQSREELTLAHEQLRHYALRIEDQATLQERNRIAREIHDSLGHSLTALSIQLENALLLLESNIFQAKEFLISAKKLNTNALSEVRQSVAKLRSDVLQGKSLESAIASLLIGFQYQTNIVPNYSLRLCEPLSKELSQTVYRIIQEALTNISKHSQANEVIIDIEVITDSLSLLIKDNGKGFNPKYNTTGFGLQGMRERTMSLGGLFRIVSTPKGGCQIMALFPLSRSL